MNKKEMDYCLNNLDRVLRYLDKPDLIRDKIGKIQPSSCVQRICSIASKIFMRLSRIWNYVCGDHVYYNELKARQIIVYYLNKVPVTERTAKKSESILQIYNQLCLISEGKGSYGDSIKNIDRLKKAQGTTPTPIQPVKRKKKHSILPKDPKTYLISKEPAESIPQKLDAAAEKHHLPHYDGLERQSMGMLLQLNGNRFAKDSRYCNGSAKYSINYLHSYLEKYQKTVPNPAIESFVSKLSLAAKLETEKDRNKFVALAKEQMQQVFKEKSSLLIPGGWYAREDSHQLYFELSDESDTAFSIRIYDSVMRPEEHSTAYVGNKVKYQPYVEWKGIEKHRLPRFFQAVAEMRTVAELEFGSNDVYNGLRKLLNPKSVDKSEKPKTLMSGQTGNVASMRGLFAMLRTHLEETGPGGKECYKRFKCDLRIQSLVDAIDTFNSDGEIQASDKKRKSDFYFLPQQSHRVVEKSLKRISCAVNRLYSKKLVSDSYLKEATEALEPVHKWLRKNQHVITKDEKPEHVYPYFDDLRGTFGISPRVIPLDEMAAKGIEAENKNLGFDVTIKLKKFSCRDPKQVENELNQILKIGDEAWKNGMDQALYTGLLFIIKQMPLELSFWEKVCFTNEKLDRKKSEQIISQLGALAKLWFKVCCVIPQSEILIPERKDALAKIHQVCCKAADFFGTKIHRTICIQSPLSFDIETVPNQKIEFSNSSSKKYISLNSSQAYYSSINGNLNMQFTSGKKYHPGLEDLAREIDPKIDDQFSNEPNYHKDACIYASAALPEWLRAIRDSGLYLQQMLQGAIAKPLLLDRSKDLEIKFKIEKGFAKINDQDVPQSTVRVEFEGLGSNIIQSYPIVYDIVSDCYQSRYEFMHGNISRDLRGAIKEMMRGNTYSYVSYGEHYAGGSYYNNHHGEKQLLNTHNVPAWKMQIEEYREIYHSFLDSETVIVEALEYFTKYPDKLLNKDYQILLRGALFGSHSIQMALKQKGVCDNLKAFFKYQFKFWKAKNEIQTCVFLLQCLRFLRAFDSEIFPDALPRLRELLSLSELEPEEKSVIYAEIIASLANRASSDLSEEDLNDLISGMVFLKNNPIPKKWEEMLTTNEVNKAVFLHSEKIKEYLLSNGEVNNDRVNSVVNRIVGKTDKVTIWKQSDKKDRMVLRSDDGCYKYMLLEGILIDQRENNVFLPIEIRTSAHFCRLFPGVKQARRIADNIYAFVHDEMETRVSLNKDSVVIEQKLTNGKWAVYIPNEAFLDGSKSCFGSRYLTDQFTHWKCYGDDTKIYFRNLQDGKVEYIASVKSTSDPIEGCSWWFSLKAVCNKAKHLLSATSKWMDHLEHGAFVHEWYEEVKKVEKESEVKKSEENVQEPEPILKKIELPRFSLSFSVDREKMSCDQIPGYFIAKQQAISQLGTYKHYLVLENEAGERKIIVPQWDFEGNDSIENQRAEVQIDFKHKQGMQAACHYFTYDFKEGLLWTKSLEANLYLVQVLTAVQDYRTAAMYLKKYGNKLSAYSDREMHILMQIGALKDATRNNEGNAAEIRVYADYLLFRNVSSYGLKSSKLAMAFQIAKENYANYLNHIKSSLEIRLEPHEEIFLVTLLLSGPDDFEPLFYLRLRELDPDPKVVIPGDPLELVSINKFDIGEFVPGPWDRNGYANNWNFKPIDFDKVMLTRVGRKLRSDFPDFYKLALLGTDEERQWLRDALCFLRVSLKAEERALAKCFTILLDHREKFTLPPEKNAKDPEWKYGNDFTLWIRPLQKTLKELEKNYEDFENGKKDDEVNLNLTPANFYAVSKVSNEETLKLHVEIVNKESVAEKFNEYFARQAQQEESSTKEFAAWIEGRVKNTQGDILQNQAYSALKDDLDKLNKQRVQNDQGHLLKENVSLKTLRSELELGVQLSKEQCEAMREDILKLANVLPGAELESLQQRLKLWGGDQKPLTIEQVIVLFARMDKNPEAIKRRNPALDQNMISELYQHVSEYLILATAQQKQERALKTLSKLEKAKDEVSRKDLEKQLAVDLLTKRSHCLPHYLAFEYFAGILLRQEQIDKIEEFLKSGNINIIMEMLMGFGKSKVLLPLLAMLITTKNEMALLISPQSLFENLGSDTQRILIDTFGQSLKTFNFTRDTSFSVYSLRTMLHEIIALQENGDCLLMTSKSLQSMLLKFVEAFDKHFKTNPVNDEVVALPEELQLMQQILNRFKATRAVVDEADSVLNVLRKVCFSLGQKRSPFAYETQVIGQVFSLLYSSEQLKMLARLESDPKPDASAPALTEKIYHHEVKRPLAEALIQRLPKIKFTSDYHQKALLKFVADNIPANEKLVLSYLIRDDENRVKAQKFFDSQCEEVQEILALLSQMVTQFLPHTLTRVNNEKYGIDPESAYAIAVPFLATNTPSKGSQFANHHITMMYTFQAIVKNGVSPSMIENEIKRLRSQAIREIGNSKKLVEETEAWKKFCILRGDVNIPLFNSRTKQVEAVVESINSSVKRKIAFVEEIVIPQLELFEEQISCNPVNMTSFLSSLSGFTGTLWNAQSMHHKMKPMPAEGINAKTLEILFKNRRDKILWLDQNSTVAMLEQLKKDSKENIDVIIDVGGYFKRGSNLQIARDMANFYKKPVVFYNKLGEQTITDGKSEMPLSQSSVSETDRIVFLDQDHTVGADVAYKRDAVGLVTVGPLMLDRDLKQGAWRLRGLDKLQKVVMAISEDVESIVKHSLHHSGETKVNHVIEFAIANQCAQQSRDNFHSFLQQLWNIPQQILLSVLKNQELKPIQQAQILKELRKLWIKPGINLANALYGKIIFERPVGEVVKEERKRCKEFIDGLHKNLPWLHYEGAAKEIDQLVEQMQSALPAKAVHPQHDAEAAMEVEQELEQQVEREVQLEAQNDLQEDHIRVANGQHGPYVDIDFTSNVFNYEKKSPRFGLNEYFNANPKLAPYANVFADLKITLNVLVWDSELYHKANNMTEFLKSLKFFGPQRTPLHFVDVEGDDVTILDQANASERMKSEGIYNLTLGFCNDEKPLSVEAQKKIVKVKFLNGDTHYNDEEIVLLKEWLKACDAEAMKEFFFEQVLSGFPRKIASYKGSVLEKAFKEMMKG